jgi:hypothetical protein
MLRFEGIGLPRQIPLALFKIRKGFEKDFISGILDADRGHDLVIMDRDSVFSGLHLASSIMHSARSILTGRSRARAHSMEVLRYLAGSRQVGEGSIIAGPSNDTRYILIIGLPTDWPSENDGNSLPEFIPGDFSGLEGSPSVERIENYKEICQWGGERSLSRILDHGLNDGEDPELAILERVALADLS